MKQLTSYSDWLNLSSKDEPFLLFVKTTNCSVCAGLYPQVEPLEEEFNIPFYVVNAAEVKELAGQLSLFTAPVVLLWKNKKEFTRFARFVPIQDLRHALKEIELMENDYV